MEILACTKAMLDVDGDGTIDPDGEVLTDVACMRLDYLTRGGEQLHSYTCVPYDNTICHTRVNRVPEHVA